MDTTTLAKMMLATPCGLGVIAGLMWWLRRDRKEYGKWLGWITITVSIGLWVISFLWLIRWPNLSGIQDGAITFEWNILFFARYFRLDALSIFFVLLVNTISLAVAWNDNAYLKMDDSLFGTRSLKSPVFFHGMVNLFHFTMLLVPMVDNLVGLWIAIELTTLFSAFLVAHEDRKESWEAAWKYLIITSTGIILALLGTMFLANAVPTDIIPTDIDGTPLDIVMNWSWLVDNASNLTKSYVWLSFLFVLVGYGTKAGLAPMHTWLPDGHGEAPAPISALLSGVLLKSALYAILRFYTLTNIVLENREFTSYILLGAGLFSLVLSAPFILKENIFKRVLAYHSLEHMGIIVFGIAIGGTAAMFGALLHCFNHAITKALMFLSYGNIIRHYAKSNIEAREITGVLRNMPWNGAFLVLGGLALVGTPPFNIFVSELFILYGALSRLGNGAKPDIPNFPSWIVIAAIVVFLVSTTLIFYGLVHHMAHLAMGWNERVQLVKEKLWHSDLGPVVLLGLIMLLLGSWIYPPLARLIQDSVVIVNRI